MGEVNIQGIEDFLTRIKDDGEFAEKTLTTSEPAQVQAIAQDAGIELTIDEIVASRELILKAMDEANQGELTDEDLDNVSGGLAVATTVALITLAGTAITVGGTLAVAGLEHGPKWAESIAKYKW